MLASLKALGLATAITISIYLAVMVVIVVVPILIAFTVTGGLIWVFYLEISSANWFKNRSDD